MLNKLKHHYNPVIVLGLAECDATEVASGSGFAGLLHAGCGRRGGRTGGGGSGRAARRGFEAGVEH